MLELLAHPEGLIAIAALVGAVALVIQGVASLLKAVASRISNQAEADKTIGIQEAEIARLQAEAALDRERRLSQAEDTIKAVYRAEIDELKLQLKAVTDAMEGLRLADQNKAQRIRDFEEQQEKNVATIASLQGQVFEMRTQLEELRTKLAKSEGRVGELEKENRTVRTERDEYLKELETVREQLLAAETTLSELERRFTAIEGKANGDAPAVLVELKGE